MVWAIGLKYNEGFSRPLSSIITVLAMIGSVWVLALPLKSISVETGYAVWTSIGVIGTAILGIVLFSEPATVARLACIGLIIPGIFGLKLISGNS